MPMTNRHGYDHCFVLNKREVGELSFAAKIYEPVSGRTMEVYTTEPGVQVYTDNWADGYKGQLGATFPRRSAICFEAQHFGYLSNRYICCYKHGLGVLYSYIR